VSESLRQAAEHPGARAIPWGVYAEDAPVGFVVIADEVDGPPYVAHYLWKLLIDQRHQQKGYGTATLDLIVEYFRGRPGVEVIWTSAGQGEGSPIPFYERYGFERTGDVEEGEAKLRLTIA
jgi:diamine N-acetyltransferase